MLPVRQELWAVCLFSCFHGHEEGRCAAVGRDPHDALTALTEEDAALTPAHAERVLGRANRHRGTACHWNSLDRLILAGVKED